MWIPIAALAVGAMALLALIGRPRHLVRAPVRRPVLGVLAVAVATLADAVSLPGGAAGRLAAAALAVAFLAANLHLRGASLALLGVLVGAVPVALNGAVTVPERVAEAVGRADGDLGPARRIEQPGDALVALGAPIPLPGTDRVARFGDLVAAVGMVDAALYALTVPRARRTRVTPRHPSARYATVSLGTALDLAGAARAPRAPRPAGPTTRHRHAVPVGAP